MRKDTHIRADKIFVSNINKLYPNTKSMREKTEKLNSILEELIYGKKKK